MRARTPSRVRTTSRPRTTRRRTVALATVAAAISASITFGPASSANAVTAPSGARYTTSIVCATGSLTVRVDATGLGGSSLIQFSIDDGGGPETYAVQRGQRLAETIDGSRFLASGFVDVTEGITPVISADYDSACPNYEANQSVAPRARFVPISPSRILDTRPDTRLNYAGGKPAAGGLFDLDVPAAASIPSNASAVVLNVTATEAGGPGFVQLFPTGRGTPGSSSNVNVERAGQTIPNAVIIPLGNGGAVSFFTQVGTHLVADISGYFVPVVGATAAGRFLGTTPDSSSIGPLLRSVCQQLCSLYQVPETTIPVEHRESNSSGRASRGTESRRLPISHGSVASAVAKTWNGLHRLTTVDRGNRRTCTAACRGCPSPVDA